MNKVIAKKMDNNFVEPIFYENFSTIVFATDEKFIPYLYVAIQSLVDNAESKNNYDIVILYEDVCAYKRDLFLALESENISIRFVNMGDYMREYKEFWYLHWDWSNAVYYRFFITRILKNYKKALYLDGDIILNFDVAELYKIDLKENWIGAIVDISQQMEGYMGESYREEVLKVKREEYFNAGVLIFNLEELNKMDFTQACISTLKELKKPIFQDQDVLNCICNQRVKYIDFSYNLLWNCINHFKDAEKRMKASIYSRYLEAWNSPKIIHFCGACKPWKQPWLSYSEHFWKYARKTPFYEVLLFEHAGLDSARTVVKNVYEKRKIYFKYFSYKLLWNITCGRVKQKFYDKTKKLEKRIFDYRKTLNE